MIRRGIGTLKRFLRPPPRSADEAVYAQFVKELAGRPRYTPGRVKVAGWDLAYVDAPALLSSVDVLVVKRWNDFVSKHQAPVILDCGANIGISVLHYKHLFPCAIITAFEPDRAICNVLRENLTLNGATDVTVVEAAVWTENGMHSFLAEGADGSRLCDTTPLVSAGDTYTVRTVRLADYLGQSVVDFIKLDVEGSESDILADCADRLSLVKEMMIEFHLMVDRPRPLAVALDVLAQAGFSIAVNSYGAWVDLIHRPLHYANNLEFDQYLQISAWRPE